MDRVAAFALTLFAVQMVEGTALYFSAGCLAVILLAGLAFNAGGGLTRAAGVYVFFFTLLDFLIGVTYKALLGEAAQTNLSDPKTTIEVYVGGVFGMLVAATLSRRFSRRTGYLENILKDENMYRACIGCIVFAMCGPFLIGSLGSGGARLGSAFTQLNELLPLGTIVGVIYEIRRSGGTRSANVPVIFSMVFSFFFFGLLAFSKQGMLEPLYCWVVPATAMRYRLSNMQIVGGIVWALLVFQVLVPYSQDGRRYARPDAPLAQRVHVSMDLLTHPARTRMEYAEIQEMSGGGPHYYNRLQGFWDRLNFIATDDALINITDQGRVFGYLPVTASFLNAIPRFLMPNKPVLNFGNMYAHEMGGLSEDDTTTGISFSPVAEAFHLGRWQSLFLVAPLVWLMLFLAIDLLCGDLRNSPWGLLAIALLSHIAPETGIGGAIYMLTFGSEILIFCAIFAAYISPMVANTVIGRRRSRPGLPAEWNKPVPGASR